MSKLETFKKEARRAEERDDFVQAIELYGRAVSEAKENPSATFEVGLYNRIGDLYLKLDDNSQAVYHYLLAVDQYADDGLYPPAIALCRKVLRVAPDQVDAYRKLARLHEATGLTADAREEMDRYLAGVWEAGQVNGAMDGLPDLVARLMSGAPDLEEIRCLKDEGKTREAFELLYRQWEDDASRWENGDANGNGADAPRDASTEEASEAVGFPQTDPSDRSLGASLRRGWQGLFGDGADEELADEPEVTGAAEGEEAAAADAREPEEADGAEGDAREADGADEPGLDHVDDMAWLREVTASSSGLAAPSPAEEAEAADRAREPDEGDAGAETDGAAAETGELELELEVVGAAREEPVAAEDEPEEPAAAEEVAASQEDAGGAVEAEGEAEGEAESVAAEEPEPGAEPEETREPAAAGESEPAAEPEEPARAPDEVLVAAAESLSRGTWTRPALTGDVAAPMLLSAAGPEVPEGRTAVAERPLDRAVRARLRQRPGARRSGGRPPEGPAFETPGREDYLPAGAEVGASAPSPRMLWLSDQVALLGAIDRDEPLAVRPSYGPPLELLRSAAEALERSATVEPVAALPADVAAPALLGAGVAEEAWVAEPVVEATPRPAFERRPPEGPEYGTPGRDDYLPAGAEIGSRLPGAALSWLADAVEHLHRLEWGEPDWMEAAREARGRAADALARLAEDAPARPALPTDLASPLLLPAARVEAEAGDAVEHAAVEEVPVAAGEREAPRPAAAAARASAPAPDGPSYQTPGRDDYLPAGAEAAEGLPSPALAWLAASVADIHRLDGDAPAWLDAPGGGVGDGVPTEDAEIRIEGFDGSEEAAARATRSALALIAAEQVVSPAQPPTDADEEAEDVDEGAPAEATPDDAEAVDAEAAEAEVVEAEVVEAEDADEEPAGEAAEAATPDADASDGAGRAAPTAPTVEPVGRPTRPARTPNDTPDLTPPVEKPAARPNGLDFTALLRRIGWLRGQQEEPAGENGSAAGSAGAEGTGGGAVGSGTDDAVMPSWSRGSSSGSDDSLDGGGPGGRDGDASGEVQPPEVGAPGSGVPDFTSLLQKVGWLEHDERT